MKKRIYNNRNDIFVQGHRKHKKIPDLEEAKAQFFKDGGEVTKIDSDEAEQTGNAYMSRYDYNIITN